MAVFSEQLKLKTKGHTDIIDITDPVRSKLRSLNIKDGIVVISVVGSTAALTTVEFEPGLVQDLKDLFNKIIPAGQYHHDEAWHDGNGHSHLRASLIGPSVTIPFSGQKLTLGTWQQIILVDFDNRPRQRKIILQFVGE